MRTSKRWHLLRASALLLCSSIFFISCAARVDDKTVATYVKASLLFDGGRFAEAAAAVEADGFAGFGVFPPSLILRGKSLWFMGNATGAERALRAASRAKPSSIEARIWLSRVLRSGGKTSEATRVVEAVLADDPGDHRALRLASELALERGDSGGARAFLDRAAESGAELGLVFLDRARLRWAAGDAKTALEDIRAASAVLPFDGTSYRAARALEKAVKEAGL